MTANAGSSLILDWERPTVSAAHIAELTRQRDALRAELDSLARGDPGVLARYHLHTGRALLSHGLDCAARERARYTPEEQAAASARLLAIESEAFKRWAQRRPV